MTDKMKTFAAVRLFLGYPLNEICSQKLAIADFAVKSTFIRPEEPYLQELEFEGTQYIGKYAGESTDLESLELLEANIYSLIKKLLVDYPCDKTSLVLLTIPDHGA